MATEAEMPTLNGMGKREDVEKGVRFKERRIRLGMSVAALAKRAGVDRGTLTRLEAGRDGAHDATLGQIERALAELEEATGVEDPDSPAGVVRFVVRGVYGADSLIVEGPVESIAELERSVDRIMRRLRDSGEDKA